MKTVAELFLNNKAIQWNKQGSNNDVSGKHINKEAEQGADGNGTDKIVTVYLLTGIFHPHHSKKQM